MKTIIRIQTSHPLNRKFNLNEDGLDKKFYEVENYFRKNGNKIIKGLERITGLSFKKNIIDIYLTDPKATHSISKPVIVGTKGNLERIVRVIIHELIHNLLWDNQQNQNWEVKVSRVFFSINKFSINIHVAVHAILEAMYRDILKQPSEIKKDKLECKKWIDYKNAWNIVEKEGYQNIIDKLKSNI